MLAPDFDIHGPAILAAADPGVLEAVAERRIRNEWGLEGPVDGYDVLLAVPDCKLLNYEAWVIAGGIVQNGLIVDCAEGQDAVEMKNRQLLADINKEELNHKSGWLVIKRRAVLSALTITYLTPHCRATPDSTPPELALPDLAASILAAPLPQGYFINGCLSLWQLWHKVFKLVGWFVPPSNSSSVW